MQTPRLLAASFLALLALVLEALFPAFSPTGASSAALTLFPWMALITAPRSTPGERAWRGALRAGLFALPPLALGMGLDRARGLEPRGLGLACFSSWILLVLWTYAAERSAGSRRVQGLFPTLWFACLPGSAALWLALFWAAGSRESGETSWASLAGANPLLWLHRWGRAQGLERMTPGAALAPVLLAVLVVLAVQRLRPAPAAGPRAEEPVP